MTASADSPSVISDFEVGSRTPVVLASTTTPATTSNSTGNHAPIPAFQAFAVADRSMPKIEMSVWYQGRKLEMYASKPAPTTTQSRAVTLVKSALAMFEAFL